MNFQKKNHDAVDQNKAIVERSQKRDANVQKNSTLYFQVGLILVLLAVFGLLEMKFESTPVDVVFNSEPINESLEYEMIDFEVEKDLVKEKTIEVKKAVVKDPTEFQVVEDDKKLIESFVEVNKPEKVTKPVIQTTDESLNIEEPQEEVNIMVVEVVPVFPGCENETTNAGRRQCLSQKLSKFVQKKFDTSLATDLGLSGEQRIFVSFMIDKNGDVTDIQGASKHLRLKKEAEEVVSKLPKITPGKHGKNNVSVRYGLPIKFRVE